LYVEDTALDFCPGKWFVGGVVLVKAMASDILLDRGQKASGFDRVGEEECGTDADEDGEKSLDDEDPAPSFKATGWSNGIQSSGEEPTKRSRK
jgi:hypothetical protein